jgi:hypothetical protein
MTTSIEINNKLFHVNIVNAKVVSVSSTADNVILCTKSVLEQIQKAVVYWELTENNANYHLSNDSLIQINDPSNNLITVTYTLHHISRPENGDSYLVTLSGNTALLDEYEAFDIGRQTIEEILIDWCADTEQAMTLEEYNLTFKRL